MKIDELAKSEDLTTKEVMKVLDTLGMKNKKSTSKLNKKEVDNVLQYIAENITKKLEVALIKKKPMMRSFPIDNQVEHLEETKLKQRLLKEHTIVQVEPWPADFAAAFRIPWGINLKRPREVPNRTNEDE